MRTVKRYGVAFATLGIAVAIMLLAYDYIVLVGPDGYNTATPVDQKLFLTLCPPSLALMALERAHGVRLLLGLSMIVAMNAALYGAGGYLVGVGVAAWAHRGGRAAN